MSDSSGAAAAAPAADPAAVAAPALAPAVAPAAAAPAVDPAAVAAPAAGASVLTDQPAEGGTEPKPGEAGADASKPDSEEKPGEVKPGEEQKPVEYAEFTLPEGLAAEDATLTLFQAEAARLGLSQEQAQGLIEKIGAQAVLNGKAQLDNWTKLNNDWTAEIKADPEMGGANFEPMRVNVGKLWDEFVGPANSPDRQALAKEATEFGWGNCPRLAKAIARIAASQTEGGHVSGNPASARLSDAEVMYPSHVQAPQGSR